MTVKRKKKRNGQTKRVSEAVQETAPVIDSEEDGSDEETVEITEVSEEGDEEDSESDAQVLRTDDEKKSLLVEEKLVRLELVKLSSFDYPSTSPGLLVFKLDNNQKYVVNETDFLIWISNPVVRP